MPKRGLPPGYRFNLPPLDTITEGGSVGVLLSNRPDRAWLDAEDYARVIEAHGFRAWAWRERHHHVRIRVLPGNPESVARLILREGNKGRISYLDGDRLNLRRANIVLSPSREPKRGGFVGTANKPPKASPVVVVPPTHAPLTPLMVIPPSTLRAVATVRRQP